MKLRYCTNCVMPSTKPDLHIDDEGVCIACRNFQDREKIDWNRRKVELQNILKKYKCQNSTNWDCIVPVSGGKDSTYQVVQILNLGLNPLCVVSSTCDLSALGRRNIENLKGLGVDLVEVSPNKNIRAKMNKIGLTQVGDISWPEHVGIFTIPVRAAVQYKVPLIIWGENSQNEYGGPASEVDNSVLTRRWLEEFGGLLGMRVSDLVGMDGIQEQHLINYTYPTDQELAEVGVTGIFLGHYIPWDGLRNMAVAVANGFQTYQKAVEGSLVNYENLDNHQTGIHDYFKFLKFGFGRVTDLACLYVRRGRISRDEALTLVKNHDGNFPWEYLGKPLGEILRPLNMSIEDFETICDKFTNKRIFLKDHNGTLVKNKSGNLTKINYDNE